MRARSSSATRRRRRASTTRVGLAGARHAGRACGARPSRRSRDARVIRTWAALRVMSQGRLSDLRAIVALSRRVPRDLPQRRHARRRARVRARAGDRRRRAAGVARRVLGAKVRCSSGCLTPRPIAARHRRRHAAERARAATRSPPRCWPRDRRVPHDRGRRAPARALLHDGRLLRLPGRRSTAARTSRAA